MLHSRILVVLILLGFVHTAEAADRLCDPAYENCRDPLIDLIRNETVAIDVAFWFMEDARYTTELGRKMQEGVPVRVLVDTRANSSYPHNATRLAELRDAGIPMRRKVTSGILHWKMMLFDGQNTVQFSAANYSSSFINYAPYENYIDEAIYFTDDSAVVNSFRTKFDDLWTDTIRYSDYANVSGTLQRRYLTYPIDPELNFPPQDSFRNRSVYHYNRESQAIDVTMYRITDRRHTDAIIAAVGRGIPVRLITEPQQYRDRSRYWHSWNVDRLYVAGVQIRHRAHQGLMHQKSVQLRSQGLTIFGSSNWTSPSTNSQDEHNYFTLKPYFFSWFTDQFERKWNNSTGYLETEPFRPLPPDIPVMVSPADVSRQPDASSITLKWNAGIWAHLYDIYFGTTPDPPLLAANQELGPSTSSSNHRSFVVGGLTSGTTYYWRIVAKTMAYQSSAGPVYTFTTEGTAPPPPTLGDDEVVLYASNAEIVGDQWTTTADSAAAGGAALLSPNRSVGKITTASANPSSYAELTFNAEAGRAYRIWLRARAESDYWGNDSVHLQFSGTVSSTGSPVFRIGTTGSTVVNLEDCSGCGLSGWGWQDNGWGAGVLGPLLYFETTGPQRVRIQLREDGLRIDQVVLSPAAYLESSPGPTTNDTTILAEASGTSAGEDGEEPPPPDPPAAGEVVLYASNAEIVGDQWMTTADSAAAGGAALLSPNRSVGKITTASANPSSYAELTFNAEAGRAYRIWLRARAESDYWGNDSVHLQFSGTVSSTGSPVFRIGTTGSTVGNLEDCSGCGLSGWGWQDNGWGVGVLGPLLYFETTGPQRMRIQLREDGLRIDQVVLSPAAYLTDAPGALKNDTTILQATP